MTAFLIALIGFTTLAAFIVPNDIYERDVYHSMTRGVMKDSKVPDKRMSEGGINPQYGLQRDVPTLKNTVLYHQLLNK